MNRVMFSSKTDMWSTPQWLFNELNGKYIFNIDVCAVSENAKCEIYFTPEIDGLSKPWVDVAKSLCLQPVFWMNPPYGRQIGKWIKKAYDEHQKGATVVCLLPAKTDTKWFHNYIYGKAEITFIKGRLKFGDSKNNAPFPSMVVVYK